MTLSECVFPPELQAAFRANNGEFGWTREQIPLVVDVLRRRSLAILGGELWWVRDEIAGWDLIPQRQGPPAVYPWETIRESGEPWPQFVERCAVNTLAAVARWPAPEDLPSDMQGRILYNLTWVSEAEFESLGSKRLALAEAANFSTMSLFSKIWNLISKKLRIRRQQAHPRAQTPSLGAYTVPGNRDLSSEEHTLIEWLIANGEPEAKKYADQVQSLHVVSHCSCGCPTIDVVVGDAQRTTTGPSEILADFLGVTPEGIEVGITLHARQGKISELEVYALGQTASSFPTIESLKQFGPTG